MNYLWGKLLPGADCWLLRLAAEVQHRCFRKAQMNVWDVTARGTNPWAPVKAGDFESNKR